MFSCSDNCIQKCKVKIYSHCVLLSVIFYVINVYVVHRWNLDIPWCNSASLQSEFFFFNASSVSSTCCIEEKWLAGIDSRHFICFFLIFGYERWGMGKHPVQCIKNIKLSSLVELRHTSCRIFWVLRIAYETISTWIWQCLECFSESLCSWVVPSSLLPPPYIFETPFNFRTSCHRNGYLL